MISTKWCLSATVCNLLTVSGAGEGQWIQRGDLNALDAHPETKKLQNNTHTDTGFATSFSTSGSVMLLVSVCSKICIIT